MEGYTTFNIQIPNERRDLLEMANNLAKTVKNTMQNVKKKHNEDIMSLEDFEKFAGIAPGGFGDMSVNEMRENKALRK